MALEDKDILNEESSTGGKPPASFGIESPVGKGESSEVEKLKRETDIVKTLWEGLNNEFQKINKAFQNQKKLVANLEKKVDSLEGRSRVAELRSIEVIGIISAVIALVLVFVNTANSQTSLENSFFVLITATSALVIFASLMHYFFNTEDKNSYKYYIASLFFFLIVIVLVGLYIFFNPH